VQHMFTTDHLNTWQILMDPAPALSTGGELYGRQQGAASPGSAGEPMRRKLCALPHWVRGSVFSSGPRSSGVCFRVPTNSHSGP